MGDQQGRGFHRVIRLVMIWNCRRGRIRSEDEAGTLEEAILRIEHAARTVRRLKSQLGAEGLTLSATREMIDELSKSLDATARALRDMSQQLNAGARARR
jgi:flagellin-like hook-associated protein FlgL